MAPSGERHLSEVRYQRQREAGGLETRVGVRHLKIEKKQEVPHPPDTACHTWPSESVGSVQSTGIRVLRQRSAPGAELAGGAREAPAACASKLGSRHKAWPTP